MDQRCHTFSFGHYHQVPGASCSILYILVLSLVIFMQSQYIPFLIYGFFHLLVIKDHQAQSLISHAYQCTLIAVLFHSIQYILIRYFTHNIIHLLSSKFPLTLSRAFILITVLSLSRALFHKCFCTLTNAFAVIKVG